MGIVNTNVLWTLKYLYAQVNAYTIQESKLLGGH